MRLSILTFSMLRDTFQKKIDANDVCSIAKINEVASLDLMEAEIRIYGEKELREAMSANGVSCSCVISTLPFYKDYADFPDRLTSAIEAAKSVCATTLMLIPGDRDSEECSAMTREEMLERAVEAYTLAVKKGSEAGITIGFENTPTFYKPLASAADCRYVLDQVPGLGFILDTANFRVADTECSELDAVNLLYDRLIRVHIKDVVIGDFGVGEQCNNGQFLRTVTTGSGIIPIKSIIRRLNELGYSGIYAVEYAADPEVHGIEHASYLRPYVQNILSYGSNTAVNPEYGSIYGVGKPISRIIFGTCIFPMIIGKNVHALLDAALANGINTFDCARGYGGAEKSLGDWVKARNNRDRVVIISKCGNAAQDGSIHIDRDVILRECAESLNALQMDYIDIYLLHRDDRNTPVSEYIEALNQLKNEGKIHVFGVSNWTHERIAEANRYAAAHKLEGFSISSPSFSLAHQIADPWDNGCITISGQENEAARNWYAANSMPLFAYSSLGHGFFSGKFRAFDYEAAQKFLDPAARRGYLCEENMLRLQKAERMADRDHCTVSAVAMRYVLNSGLNVYAVVSASKPDRLAGNVAASRMLLSDKDIAILETIDEE